MWTLFANDRVQYVSSVGPAPGLLILATKNLLGQLSKFALFRTSKKYLKLALIVISASLCIVLSFLKVVDPGLLRIQNSLGALFRFGYFFI